ncbi:MAG: hypothetical protein KC776_01945 [Myxococcales bacterium]|nr:hypothetical protein [Myxococcales bacterium]MCB9579512.1 hypothetical protein [Polyangiaceae bacterium]
MRHLFLLGLAALLGSTLGCATTCIEGANGVTCTAKSLKRFDGAPPQAQAFNVTPGAPLNIDVQYGNVLVTRSTTPQVIVEFRPFCYAGHDEQATAQQFLTQNLRMTATGAGAITAVSGRNGGSNGLGADVIVRVPDGFNGAINVLNRGDGPVNEFGLKIEGVGHATALTATNQALLGSCWIQGAPSVKSTTVQCRNGVSVFDVSDAVNITNTDPRHDASSPAITLRMASVSPGSPGGTVTATSGSVAATFPRAGGYVIQAQSPVNGAVQEGSVPPSCQLNAAAPNNKTLSCGGGPAYRIIAGAQPDTIGPPPPANVMLSYQ